MIIRKISKNNNFKAITLPEEWGRYGQYVKWRIIDEKTIMGTIIDE